MTGPIVTKLEDETYEDEYERHEDDLESKVEDLESRLGELESDHEGGGEGSGCISAGYSFGATLAAILSWNSNHASGWMLMRGMLSSIYVIYWAAIHRENLKIF